MHRSAAWVLGLLLTAGFTYAAEPAPKIVQETWDAAFLDGQRAGYARTAVEKIERDAQEVLRTTVTLELVVRRFNQTVTMRVDTGTEETPKGKVVAVFMRQALGKNQNLVLRGTVQGKELLVKIDQMGKPIEKKVAWNDQVVGLYREQQLFQDKAVKPGDRFSYLHYEPLLNSVVQVHAAVKDFEEIKVGGIARKLLRVEVTSDKIGGMQLPATAFWLDKEFKVVRSQVEMPGLGKLVTSRCTRAEALKDIVPAQLNDIGLSQLVPLNRRIPHPSESKRVLYRITLPGDDDPATAFARDNRQKVKAVKGKTVDLEVRAVRQPPAKIPEGAEVGEEFRKSNYFVNSADERVQELARKAVGKETDPWKKAQRIERWVKENMKVLNFTEAMATADHVAKTLEGDCTEHAMLAAAMCRAAGVPSKIAIGLVYVDQARPVMGFHMWTEVWVRGEWVPIDATLGQGSIGAAHLKISDHSWHDTQSLKPLLPVMRVMLAKPTIEVVQVGEGE